MKSIQMHTAVCVCVGQSQSQIHQSSRFNFSSSVSAAKIPGTSRAQFAHLFRLTWQRWAGVLLWYLGYKVKNLYRSFVLAWVSKFMENPAASMCSDTTSMACGGSPSIRFLCPWLATMAFLVPRPAHPAPLHGPIARAAGKVAVSWLHSWRYEWWGSRW